MIERGFDSPEIGVLSAFSPENCRVVSSSAHGDLAYVLLDAHFADDTSRRTIHARRLSTPCRELIRGSDSVTVGANQASCSGARTARPRGGATFELRLEAFELWRPRLASPHDTWLAD